MRFSLPARRWRGGGGKARAAIQLLNGYHCLTKTNHATIAIAGIERRAQPGDLWTHMHIEEADKTVPKTK